MALGYQCQQCKAWYPLLTYSGKPAITLTFGGPEVYALPNELHFCSIACLAEDSDWRRNREAKQ
jgi:hypothetical protein